MAVFAQSPLDLMDSTTTASHRTTLLRWLERALMATAILCLGIWAYSWLDAAYVQHRDNQILDEALNGAPANSADAAPPGPGSAAETDALGTFSPPPPAGNPPPPPMLDEGSLVGRIEIPRVGVESVVLEGADDSTLRRGVGHIPETALPGHGTSGNVGLAAHRDSFFRGLKDIRKNDIIRLQTLDGTFRYRVEWTRIVLPEETSVLASDGVSELTLVTCYPFYYVGSAPKRFIVRARADEVGTGTSTD
jgi:sortase A